MKKMPFLVLALLSACSVTPASWSKDTKLANTTWLAVEPVITQVVTLKDPEALPKVIDLETKISAELLALTTTTAPTSVSQVTADFQTLLSALPVCTSPGIPSGCVLTLEQSALAQGVLSLINVLGADLTANNKPVLRYVST